MNTKFIKAAFLSALFMPMATVSYGQWSVTGNAGTNSATNFLGTTDAQDVVIKAGGLERMRIGNGGLNTIGTGDFLIGSGAPSLTVQSKYGAGTYGVGRSASFLLNDVSSTLNSIVPYWRVNINEKGPFTGTGPINAAMYSNGVWKYYFSVASTGNTIIGDHTGIPFNGYGLYVVKNVIIGTVTSTGNMLSVNGDASFSGTSSFDKKVTLGAAGATANILTVNGGAFFSGTTSFAGNANFINASYSGTSSFNAAVFYGGTSFSSAATFTAASFSSNVSIGALQSKPAGYGLYVADGILTEKVKVAIKTTANWSDFVFAKDYQLSPLNELEKYINKNHHLPGLPSAEEVVKDGVDLATMDAKLLQKVEEVTLYLIEMEKKLEFLKTENSQLKKQISKK